MLYLLQVSLSLQAKEFTHNFFNFFFFYNYPYLSLSIVIIVANFIKCVMSEYNVI
jgi:hypothetical protein